VKPDISLSSPIHLSVGRGVLPMTGSQKGSSCISRDGAKQFNDYNDDGIDATAQWRQGGGRARRVALTSPKDSLIGYRSFGDACPAPRSNSLTGNIMRDYNTFETRRKEASANETIRGHEAPASFLRKVERTSPSSAANPLAGMPRSRADRDRSAPDRAPEASGVLTMASVAWSTSGRTSTAAELAASRLQASASRGRGDLFPRRPLEAPEAYPKNEAQATGCAHQAWWMA
jgi:hypothetical protein